jgi:hypothetical protein
VTVLATINDLASPQQPRRRALRHMQHTANLREPPPQRGALPDMQGGADTANPPSPPPPSSAADPYPQPHNDERSLPSVAYTSPEASSASTASATPRLRTFRERYNELHPEQERSSARRGRDWHR